MSTENNPIHFCPLCDHILFEDGDYYQCKGNPLHRIHRVKEWTPYVAGDKSKRWITWRMKVRLGKMRQSAANK